MGPGHHPFLPGFSEHRPWLFAYTLALSHHNLSALQHKSDHITPLKRADFQCTHLTQTKRHSPRDGPHGLGSYTSASHSSHNPCCSSRPASPSPRPTQSPPDPCKAHSLTAFMSSLKRQLPNDTTSDHPIEYYHSFPSSRTCCLLSLLYFSP